MPQCGSSWILRVTSLLAIVVAALVGYAMWGSMVPGAPLVEKQDDADTIYWVDSEAGDSAASAAYEREGAPRWTKDDSSVLTAWNRQYHQQRQEFGKALRSRRNEKLVVAHFVYALQCTRTDLRHMVVLDRTWNAHHGVQVHAAAETQMDFLSRVVSGCEDNPAMHRQLAAPCPGKAALRSKNSAACVVGAYFSPSFSNVPLALAYWTSHVDLTFDDYVVVMDPHTVFLRPLALGPIISLMEDAARSHNTTRVVAAQYDDKNHAEDFLSYGREHTHVDAVGETLRCPACPRSASIYSLRNLPSVTAVTAKVLDTMHEAGSESARFSSALHDYCITQPIILSPYVLRGVLSPWAQLLATQVAKINPHSPAALRESIALSIALIAQGVVVVPLAELCVRHAHQPHMWVDGSDAFSAPILTSCAYYGPAAPHVEVGDTTLHDVQPLAAHENTYQSPMISAFVFAESSVPDLMVCRTPLLQEFHQFHALSRELLARDYTTQVRRSRMLEILVPMINSAIAHWKTKIACKGKTADTFPNLQQRIRLTKHPRHFYVSKYLIVATHNKSTVELG